MADPAIEDVFTVPSGSGQRLDLYLSSHYKELSRSQLQAYIKSGKIRVNAAVVKPKYRLEGGERITVSVPESSDQPLLAENLALEILHEEDTFIVLNKAPGMVVHPAPGTPSGTVVNALLSHCEGMLAQTEQAERPGVVHRLDKDTSGCLIVAKHPKAHQSLSAQFANRETRKQYLAVTQCPPVNRQGTIFTHIGRHPVHRQKMAVVEPGTGKAAITDYYQLSEAADGTCLVLCVIHTGRTHQIRVHLKHVGAAILGDSVYAHPSRQPGAAGRLMLHAWRLGVNDPDSGERLQFEAPLPSAFEKWTLPVSDLLHSVRGDTFPFLLPQDP